MLLFKNYEDASIVLYLRLTEVITECGVVGFKYCNSCLWHMIPLRAVTFVLTNVRTNHWARCPLDLTTDDADSFRRRDADLSLQTVQPRALRHTKVVWSNSGPQSALHAVTTSHASQGFTSSSPVYDRIRLWFAFTVLFRGPVSTCESGPVTGYSRVRLGLRTFHSAASDLLLVRGAFRK